MPNFGLGTYGQDVYGDLSTLSFDVAPFVARATEPRTLLVSWSVPSGAWTGFKLVRSSYGVPVNEQDGTVLVDSATPTVSIVDTDLAAGSFYYYAIYLFTANTWLLAGATTGLVLGDHDHGSLLYSMLPEFWRESDSSVATVSKTTRDNAGVTTTSYVGGTDARSQPLQRFLNLVGREFDRVRTEQDTLLFLRDPDRIAGGLLGPLNLMLAVGDEGALGMAQQRVIARNAIYLRKTKGTYLGLEAAVSAYTSYGATVTDGKNIALTRGYEHVTVTNGSATTDRTGEPILLATGDGGGDMTVSLTPAGYYIPVGGSTTYSVQVKGRSDATARNIRLEGRWLGADGTQLATFTTTAALADATGNVTSGTDTSHANAVWLGLDAVVTTPGNAEEYEISELQVEQAGSPTAWEEPRALTITMQPTRRNLTNNPTFEVDTVGWSGTNTTLARTTDDAYSGAASLRATPGTGQTNVHTYTTDTVDPGETYTSSAYVKAEHAGTESYRLWTTSRTGGTQITATHAYGDTTPLSSADGWVRLDVTYATDGAADNVIFRVQQITGNSDPANTYLVDAVMTELAPDADPYFDAGSSADAIWEGTAHNSPSAFYPKYGVKAARLGTLIPTLLPPEREFTLVFGPGA